MISSNKVISRNIYLIVRYGFINFRLIYCKNIKRLTGRCLISSIRFIRQLTFKLTTLKPLRLVKSPVIGSLHFSIAAAVAREVSSTISCPKWCSEVWIPRERAFALLADDRMKLIKLVAKWALPVKVTLWDFLHYLVCSAFHPPRLRVAHKNKWSSHQKRHS